MTADDAERIQNWLRLGADSLRRAGKPWAERAARVTEIREALSTGDDSTAWDDLGEVIADLDQLTVPRPDLTAVYAATLVGHPMRLPDGVDRAIDQIGKAQALVRFPGDDAGSLEGKRGATLLSPE